MAASIRIAQIVGASAPAVSQATGRSQAFNGATIRIAEVDGSSGSSVAAIRIAEIQGVSGSTNAVIRIAGVVGASIENTFIWDGSDWVDSLPPPSIAPSSGRGTSAGSGTVAFSATVNSVGHGRSNAPTGVGAFSGTLALAGSGNLTLTGFKNPTGTNGVGSLNLTGGGPLTLVGFAHDGLPGAGSVSVFPQPDNAPPRIEILVAGFLGPTAEIVRNQVDGSFPVRLAHPATLVSGAVLLYDYEAPFNQAVTYTLTPTTGPGAVTSDPVTLTVDTPWLLHPGIPDLSAPIRISAGGIGPKTRPVLTAVNTVLGRRNPIVETDGQRKSPVFQLTLRVTTAAEATALDQITDDTTPLLLQVTYPFTDVQDYAWVSLSDSQLAPLAEYGNPAALFTTTCTVVDPPAGLLTAQRTWADLLAEEATWQDVLNDFATWQDVITDTRIGD